MSQAYSDGLLGGAYGEIRSDFDGQVQGVGGKGDETGAGTSGYDDSQRGRHGREGIYCVLRSTNALFEIHHTERQQGRTQTA